MMMILVWVSALLASMVITGCICRVNIMAWRNNKAGWLLLYIAFAYFAGDVAIDALQAGAIDPHDAVILAALVLYMHLTKGLWHSGPPPVTRRPS